MGGVSAAVAKTAAAPIERIKLLVQNQDEMYVGLVNVPRLVLNTNVSFPDFCVQDQARSSRHPLQGYLGLLQANLRRGGYGLALARKHRQRH